MNPADIAVEIDNYNNNIELSRLFPGDFPVEIEVGSGKGTFLLNQARQHRDLNYLGIEWANKYYRYSIDRMARWQMTNVRILRSDAREFIRCCLSDNSVQKYHVYFPDPWPKKRHHKRRFFQPANILQVHRTLVPGGELRTATDHAEYYQWITELMLKDERIALRFEPVEFFAADAADEGEWVGSNFERKYLKEGRPIYTLALRKKT